MLTVKKTLSIVYKLMLSLLGITAILSVAGLFRGDFSLSSFRYFTIQSCLLSVVYFLIDAVYLMNKNHRSGDVWLPVLKGIQMMGVSFTCLVSLIYLRDFDMGGTNSAAIICLHYVLPVMSVADWLLFDRKRFINAVSPLVWAVFPLAYFAYSMLCAVLSSGSSYESRFVYPFIDADAIGLDHMILNVVFLTVVFFSTGYLYFLIDNIPAWIKSSRMSSARFHQPPKA